MNFPDYQRLNAEEPCCVTHQEVRTYLQNYAKHFDLLKYIQVRAKYISYIVYKYSKILNYLLLRRYNIIVRYKGRICPIKKINRRQRRMGCPNKNVKNEARGRDYF